MLKFSFMAIILVIQGCVFHKLENATRKEKKGLVRRMSLTI